MNVAKIFEKSTERVPNQDLSNCIKLIKQGRIAIDIQFFFAILGIICMLIDNELYTNYNHKTHLLESYLMQGLNSVCTIIVIASILFNAFTSLRVKAVINNLSHWKEAVTADFGGRVLMEILVCSIHPFPCAFKALISVADEEHSDASVVGILSVLMFFRLYIVVKFAAAHTYIYPDVPLLNLCVANRVEFDTIFVMKAHISRNPGTILMIIVAFIIGFESWAMRTCERFYSQNTELHSFKDAIWLTTITFLTVGYGDVYPRSYCGRLISVSTGFSGVCATALVIALLSEKVRLSKSEKIITQYASQRRFNNTRERLASNIVLNVLKLWVQKHRGNPLPNYTKNLVKSLENSVSRLREIREKPVSLEQNNMDTIEINSALTQLNILVKKTHDDILRIEERLETVLKKTDLTTDKE